MRNVNTVDTVEKPYFSAKAMYVDTVNTMKLQCGFLYKVFELHETLIKSFELQQNSK